MDIFFVCDATRMTINEHKLFTNNIYETFMVIYGHLRDAVGKGAGAVFSFFNIKKRVSREQRIDIFRNFAPAK